MFPMNELNQSRVSLVMHTAVAIAMGWVSVLVASMSRTLFAVIIGIVVLCITGFAAQRVTKQKGIKLWAANGILIYLLLWFVSWTLFHNIAIA